MIGSHRALDHVIHIVSVEIGFQDATVVSSSYLPDQFVPITDGFPEVQQRRMPETMHVWQLAQKVSVHGYTPAV